LPSGIIDLNEFEKAVTKEPTIAASVMGVNNEIGIIQPLKEIG
jgi:cysteine desulfurase